MAWAGCTKHYRICICTTQRSGRDPGALFFWPGRSITEKGAFIDLRAFVDHYSESHLKLRNFNPNQLEPALRGTVLPNTEQILANRDPLLEGVVFTPQQVDEVTEFMKEKPD